MMKKSTKVDFKVMSGWGCSYPGCSKKIKMNLVSRKPKAKSFLCYPHHIAIVNEKKNQRR
jgi:hypothetical protein